MHKRTLAFFVPILWLLAKSYITFSQYIALFLCFELHFLHIFH